VQPRTGNDPDRIAEIPGGLLNAIGLANVGLERFLTEKVPFLRTMDTAVLVNVAGHSESDYLQVCERLDAEGCIAGLELNVSCPNVSDGLMFGTDAQRLGELICKVRQVVKRSTLIVKLSPNVTDITEFARAAIDNGAEVLSLINTYVGLSIDTQTWRPRLANVTGGLSGPAIKPLAVHAVHRVYREVARDQGIPILGMGGIRSVDDAVEFMLAGASAVAIGTQLFNDPQTPLKIASELTTRVKASGLGSVRDLVGAIILD
jgi:dihydroorotate dehydrogenase (NAD+) catalytic subunit